MSGTTQSNDRTVVSDETRPPNETTEHWVDQVLSGKPRTKPAAAQPTTAPSDTSRLSTRSLAETLRKVTSTLEVIVILGAVIGALGGLVLAMQSETTESIWSSTTDYPYVTFGVGLAIASVINGMFVWCVARALRIYAASLSTLNVDRSHQ